MDTLIQIAGPDTTAVEFVFRSFTLFIFSFSPSLSNRLFFVRGLRRQLAIALAVLIFAVPLAVGVSAARDARQPAIPASATSSVLQGSNAVADKNSQKSGVDSFIIEMVDGVSTCRKARPAEVSLTLPRPDDRGIPVRELLKTNLENQQSQGGVNSATGLTINLNALQQLQNDSNKATVIAAFQQAAGVWTARIKSPVTISVNIDYGVNAPDGTAFPSGVLGATSSGSISVDYPGARNHLVTTASSPGETSLYNSLPGSVIPTDTGDGSVISISRSLAQPLAFVPLNPNEIVATIAFNKHFTFDFNPDDGINSGAIDFVAVAAHEIGHALGFVSDAGEGSTAQVSLWDMFRFRPGTTTGTFATAQRIMSIGGGSQVYFTGQTFVVGSVGTNELGLSTGGPDPAPGDGDGNQSSHWKADEITGQYIGIMDPTIASGVHRDATDNDFSALETLGWNLVDSTPPPAPPPPASNDNFANAQTISGCSGSVTGTNLNATKETGEPNHANGGGTRSVWYQWQAPSSGSVTMTTAGSGFDTVLAVYTGTTVNALNLIASNDDASVQPHITTSSVTFPANAGTIYQIAVDGFNNDGSGGDEGPIKLNWLAANCVDSSVQFSSAAMSATETPNATTKINLTVTRTGNISTAASINYATSDVTASERSDYLAAIGTLRFAANESSQTIPIFIVDDSYGEGPETFNVTLSNAVNCVPGSPATLTVTINSDESVNGPNPVTDASFNTDFFVRQHYVDFFNREADPAGLAFWKNQIDECTTPECRELRKINVSAAFFLSIEFQQTGYLVYKANQAAFNSQEFLKLRDFLPDTQRIGHGVVIGQPGADAQLEANKQEFFLDFVQRPKFTDSAAFPASMTAEQFVDKLNGNTFDPRAPQSGGSLTVAERNNLVSQLSPNPSSATLRAQVLRSVSENALFHSRQFNKAFVLMQYFGYLRRNPNDPPELGLDFAGYNFWLTKLNQFNGNFVNAEMVKAFIVSSEYQQRFGP